MANVSLMLCFGLGKMDKALLAIDAFVLKRSKFLLFKPIFITNIAL